MALPWGRCSLTPRWHLHSAKSEGRALANWRTGLGRRSAGGLFEVGALAIGVTVGNIIFHFPSQVAIDLRGIAAYAKAKLRYFLVRELGTASYHHWIARQRDP
jgi:hypothetical protein